MKDRPVTVQVRIPGKLMLAGEYAVLAGGQALAVTVDHFLTVTATRGTPGSGLIIASPLWPEPLSVTGADLPPVAKPFADAAQRLATRYGLSAVRLTADDGIDVAHGLGSSGALRLGTAMALAQLAGHPGSAQAAAAAAYDLQQSGQGVASGYDIITQQHGGLVLSAPCAPGVTWPGAIETLPQGSLARLAGHLAIFVGGRGAPTGPVSRATARWLTAHHLNATLFDLSQTLVQALVAALTASRDDDRWPAVHAAIGAHRRLLAQGPHAPHHVLQALATLPGLDQTASFKTTGAGGEDALIVFGDGAVHAAAAQALRPLGWQRLDAMVTTHGAEFIAAAPAFNTEVPTGRFVARAPSNIALIKYWGKRDVSAQWPANDSLSMTLSAAHSLTSAVLTPDEPDCLMLNGKALAADDPRAKKALAHVARLRHIVAAERGEGTVQAGLTLTSENSFPSDAGIASSASGFAALTLATLAAFTRSHDFVGLTAAGFDLDRLASLARLGSGSACRSLAGGYVAWHAGDTPLTQSVEAIFPRTDEAPADVWRLADIILILSKEAKAVSSSTAHQAAWGSPHYASRLAAIPARLAAVRAAIDARDLAQLGALIEAEADEMHLVMETGTPPIRYQNDETEACRVWLKAERAAGRLEAYMTLDAGPNPHVLCRLEDTTKVATALAQRFPRADVLIDQTGDGPELLYIPLPY